MRKFLFFVMAMTLLVLASPPMRADKVGDGEWTLPGLYTFEVSDGSFDNSYINVEIVENAMGGTYVMISEEFPTAVTFTYDASIQTLRFEMGTNQGVSTSGEDIFFSPGAYWPGNDDSPAYFERYDVSYAYFDPTTGKLTFNDDGGQFFLGWYFQYYEQLYDKIVVYGGQQIAEPEVDSSWTDLGDATLVDGWVLPMLGIDQNLPENQYKVLLQQNTENKNLYRLVNPYKYGPAAAVNIHPTKEGYIEFDVTDPAHVLFNKVEAGFAYDNPADGEQKFKEFYCNNWLGNYVLAYPNYSPSQIANMMSEVMCFTTFEDGVVSLNLKDFGDGDISYDARFGTENKPNCGGYWEGADMTARIVFPGATLPEEPGDEPGEDNPTEGNITGTVTSQVDMNMGMEDEPDLTDPETYDVTALYNEETALLTIFNFSNDDDFLPITFNVDVTAGTAVAADQVAFVDDSYADDSSYTYYYCEIATQKPVINANIYSTADGKTKLVVSPWGAGMEFGSYGFFFVFAYYNTEVVLDLKIAGLPAEPASGEPTEGDIEGTMTTQVDMNMGMGEEPDLTAPDTYDVTALYNEEAATLTIFNFADDSDFNPITFNVDVENGTATALSQIAYTEDGLEYYYADVLTKNPVVYANIYATEEGKTKLVVSPWGAGADFPGYGYFFLFAYFNTEIVLDCTIEGLPSEPASGEPTEGDIEGSMTSQVDMNMGMGEEPELLPAETTEVTATYDAETSTLTIYNFAEGFNPITFNVDIEKGTAIAVNQVAYSEEGFEYYYSDVATKYPVVYASIYTSTSGETMLVVSPWGPGFDFPGYGFFFTAAYYNTIITLDFTIEGLPEGNIDGSMTYQVDMNMGMGEEPELTEPETIEVKALYDEEAATLTIFNFAELMPITFNVDINAGTAVATDQVAFIDDWYEDDVYTYYYWGLDQETPVVNATISTTVDGKTKFVVSPWGEGMEYTGGFFFNSAYFNTEVILDFTIDGLAREEALVFNDFRMTVTENSTETVTTTVPFNLVVNADPFTYKGIQFDLTIPDCVTFEGFKFNEGISINEEGTNFRYIEDLGVWRLVGAFTEPTTITDGVVSLELSLTYSHNLEAGIYPIQLNDVVLSTTLGQDIYLNPYTGYVNIEIFSNPADKIEIVSVTLMEPSYSYDVAEDGTLTEITDVTEVVAGQSLQVVVVVEPTIPGYQVTDFVELVSSNPNAVVTRIYPEEYEGIDNVFVYEVTTSDFDEEMEGSVPVTLTATSMSKGVTHASDEYSFDVMGVLLGDSNNNRFLSVADVVTTANYIVDKPDAVFCFPNANVILNEVDGQQVINTDDLTATVSIVLEEWDNNRTPAASSIRRQTRSIVSNDALTADNFNAAEGAFDIAVRLDNSYSYAALQASVIVPEGMTVTGIKAGPRAANHEIVVNITEYGRVNVVLYSLTNDSFIESNDALFYIQVEADSNCGDITIEGIHASDAESNGYELRYAGGMNDTNGIEGIATDAESGVRYFNIQGVEVTNPETGSILIRVENGKAEKVVVK